MSVYCSQSVSLRSHYFNKTTVNCEDCTSKCVMNTILFKRLEFLFFFRKEFYYYIPNIYTFFLNISVYLIKDLELIPNLLPMSSTVDDVVIISMTQARTDFNDIVNIFLSTIENILSFLYPKQSGEADYHKINQISKLPITP